MRALAPELELRQRLEALSCAVLPPQAPQRKDKLREPPNPEPLLAWAESAPLLGNTTLASDRARVLPAFTVLAWLWQLLRTRPVRVGERRSWSRVSALLHARRDVVGLRAVSSTEGAFLRYGGMLALLESLQPKAELLDAMKARITTGGVSPSAAMSEFRRKVGWFDLKHNGLIHPAVNTLLLWDIQCVLALESWQRRAGGTVRKWFTTLGELKRLSSLAGLRTMSPEYASPGVVATTMMYWPRARPSLIDAPGRAERRVLPAPGTAFWSPAPTCPARARCCARWASAPSWPWRGRPSLRSSFGSRAAPCAPAFASAIRSRAALSHFYAEISKLTAVVERPRNSNRCVFLLDESARHELARTADRRTLGDD